MMLFCRSNPLCVCGSGSRLLSRSDLVKASTKEEKRRRKEARRQELLEKQKLKSAKTSSRLCYEGKTKAGDKKNVSAPLPSVYTREYVEAAWYDWWCQAGFFKPEYNQKKLDGNFTVVLPPPNVTGTLHLGHALGNSIQDALCRWHRMHGKQVLWNPGCDHAGIATQVVVEKELLRDTQKTRHDIGREKFLEKVWEWKTQKGDTIHSQMRSMGLSLDWSRNCFTLDPKLCEAVTEAFVKLYEEGLIYRSSRLVNWSCALNSTISDIEVDNVEIDGHTKLEVPGYKKKVDFGLMYRINYPVHESDEFVTVDTTRPETMLGDTAIAVHPDDARYTHLHQKHVLHPISGEKLPIVCDQYADKKKGTGAVKITPGHDCNDFEVGVRHGLAIKTVIDDSGLMKNVPDLFEGLKRFEARQKVLEYLSQQVLYHGCTEHKMVLPVCSRTGDVVEPLLKDQWFVDCTQMAKDASEVVAQGKLVLLPDVFEKQWFEWLSNPKTSAWCISRQLWWGHRVPAYRIVQPERDSDRNVWVVAKNEEDALSKAAQQLQVNPSDIRLEQDEDVLDTWFSSAIYPFSIFGWPHQTADFSTFYPTDLMVTASDILFFWVARMVMLGQKLTGNLPFKEVLLHSILRDSHGRKMSKSLGNIIDPMDVVRGISLEELQGKLSRNNLTDSEVRKAGAGQKKDFPLGIPECGTDALRFTLCSYHYLGYFSNVDVTHIESNRKFCNKIWQAFRFCQLHWTQDFTPLTPDETIDGASPTDLWILSRLSCLVEQCDQHFSSLHLYGATKALHSFWWSDLCDTYIEYSKLHLSQEAESRRKTVIRTVLFMCVDTGLRCLSPFMPFLTEELYQRLPGTVSDSVPSICVAPYPKVSQYQWRNHVVEEEIELAMKIVSKVRTLRRWLGLTKTKVPLYFTCSKEGTKVAVERHKDVITMLSRSASLDFLQSQVPPGGCINLTMGEDTQIHFQIENFVDAEQALSKLKSEAETVRKSWKQKEKDLSQMLLDDTAEWSKEQSQAKHLEQEQEALQDVQKQLLGLQRAE